jgi:chromosome segregation ATPase
MEQARANVDAARRELEQAKAARDEMQQGSQHIASQLKAAEEALTKARKLADEDRLQLNRTRAELSKWRAAELNIAVYSARREMKDREAEYAARFADAAQASSELERAKADLAGAEKALAEAPQAIKAREQEIVAAQLEVQETAAGVELAKKLAEDRGSLAATALAFAEDLQREAGVSPDDQPLADAAAKAKATAELVASSLARSKQAITAALEKTDRAKARVAAAQAALAKTRDEEATAPARISKLRETALEIAERTAHARSAADTATLAAKKVFEVAKQRVDELTQRYRGLRAEAEEPLAVVAK